VTLLVLFILALIWAAVLLPPWLQNRSQSRPADSISSFQKQLSVLERRSGTASPGRPPIRRAPVAPKARAGSVAYRPATVARTHQDGVGLSEVRRRRRDVLFTLIAAAVITALLAAVLGGPVLMLHLAVDVLLVAYVALLVRTQRLSAEREVKVRYLGQGRQAPEPAFLLRRSGN
jgi:hypothetical protein